MSDKEPQWPGPDGKPGVSFAPKGSRKQRNQAQTQQKQLPSPGKTDTASTTNLKPTKAPESTKPTAAPQGPAQSEAPQKAAVAKGSGTKSPQQAPLSPQSAPQAPGKSETPAGASGGTAPAAPSAAAMWATPSPAPLTPLPAPDGSSGKSSVSKPVKAEAKSEARSTEITKGGTRRTRKARLRLSRIDPWSVMKTAFLFSIAFGIILVVIAAVLWQVIEGSGALESVNSTMNQLIGDANTKFAIQDYINSGRVVGLVTLLAAVDVVILTAVATLFAFLYNLAATVLGGLEITLAED